MTQKELCYVEDALEHISMLETICNEMAVNVEDEELKKLLQKMSKSHKKHFKDFYELINK